MRNKRTRWLLIAAACIGAALLCGCPQDEPVTGGEEDVTLANHDNTIKLNKKGQRVVQVLWQEPWPDPRVQLGYQLDDEAGTPFFDHYVMLYGFRLADRDCATNPGQACNLTGLHIHVDGYANTREYIFNYEKYFKPLHDRGMKILFSIVPHSNGVCVGTLYNWPKEASQPWYDMYGEAYPYDEKAVAKLIEQIKEIYAICPFDGLAYDEEYASNKDGKGRGDPYPSSTAEKRIAGENMLRFAWEVEQAIQPLHKDADGKEKEWLNSVYEIRTATAIPASATFIPTGKTEPVTVYRDGIGENDPEGRPPADPVFDHFYESMYGNWQAASANGVPKSHFGPASIAVSDKAGGPRPPPGREGPGVVQYMEDHARLNYGVVMYYGLQSRTGIRQQFPDHFGPNNPYPETYFSQIATALYGHKVVYLGRDYHN